jgi:hypothetical protein
MRPFPQKFFRRRQASAVAKAMADRMADKPDGGSLYRELRCRGRRSPLRGYLVFTHIFYADI